MIVYLGLFARLKICSCNLYSGEFFTGIVHFRALIPANKSQHPPFLYFHIPHDHSIFFVLLSQKQIDGSAMRSSHFSLALILSARSAHRAGSISALPWFFRPSLELAFIGDPVSPSRVCDSSAFAACYLCPTAMFFIIQVMLVLEIYAICSVQNLFLRQFLSMCHSVCQFLLTAHIFSVLSVPSVRDHNIFLMPVYVLPPVCLIVDSGLAEFFDPFQILRTLQDVFLLCLPCV